MRQARIKPTAKFSTFFCVSKKSDQFPKFSHKDRSVLVDLLHRYAEYSGINLLAWSITETEVQLLINIPKQTKLSDEDLIARVERIAAQSEMEELLDVFDSGTQAKINTVRKQHISRMRDISMFFKMLNQKFSLIIFQRTGENKGGQIWHDRHKSIPVENKPEFLTAAAIRIHANPVRQGSAERADQYEFSSLTRACKKAGIERDRMLEFSEQEVWRELIAQHRKAVIEFIDTETRVRLPGYIGSRKFGQAIKEQRAAGSNGRSHAEVKKMASKRIAALKRFRKRFGHSNVPREWEGDPELGKWLYALRRKKKLGRLSEDMRIRLEELGVDWDFDYRFAQWEQRLESLIEFQKETGRKDPPSDTYLHSWCAMQRAKKKEGRLTPTQIKMLNKIGFEW